jgi:hypothetical protein
MSPQSRSEHNGRQVDEEGRDFHEGDKIDEKALQALIRAAVALNTPSAARRMGTRA